MITNNGIKRNGKQVNKNTTNVKRINVNIVVVEIAKSCKNAILMLKLIFPNDAYFIAIEL